MNSVALITYRMMMSDRTSIGIASFPVTVTVETRMDSGVSPDVHKFFMREKIYVSGAVYWLSAQNQ